MNSTWADGKTLTRNGKLKGPSVQADIKYGQPKAIAGMPVVASANATSLSNGQHTVQTRKRHSEPGTNR